MLFLSHCIRTNYQSHFLCCTLKYRNIFESQENDQWRSNKKGMLPCKILGRVISDRVILFIPTCELVYLTFKTITWILETCRGNFFCSPRYAHRERGEPLVWVGPTQPPSSYGSPCSQWVGSYIICWCRHLNGPNQGLKATPCNTAHMLKINATGIHNSRKTKRYLRHQVKVWCYNKIVGDDYLK